MYRAADEIRGRIQTLHMQRNSNFSVPTGLNLAFLASFKSRHSLVEDFSVWTCDVKLIWRSTTVLPETSRSGTITTTLEVIHGNLYCGTQPKAMSVNFHVYLSEKRPCLMTKVLPIFQVWVRIFCLLRKNRYELFRIPRSLMRKSCF